MVTPPGKATGRLGSPVRTAKARTVTSDVLRKPGSGLLLALLALAAALELIFFIWLCLQGPEGFKTFVCHYPDTAEYARVGEYLVERGAIPTSPRTLGYPLFLSGCLFLGGSTYGYHVAVAVQLVANLLLGAGFWFASERLAPQLGVWVRGVATAILLYAGFGLSLFILTDFLAGFLFTLFLWALILKRRWPWVVAAGICLFLATLIRPTFNYFPILLPGIVYLVGRCYSKVPLRQTAFYILCGASAVALSTAIEHRDRDATDSFGFLYLHFRVLVRTNFYPEIKEDHDYDALYRRECAAAAGKPLDQTTRAEKDQAAKRVFVAHVRSQPARFARNYGAAFLKYAFAPIETLVQQILYSRGQQDTYYFSHARPVLVLLWLPLWLLSLFPPVGSKHTNLGLYVLVMTVLLYVLGLSALGSGGGERIRFPVLPFLLILAAVNANDLFSILRQRRIRGQTERSPKVYAGG